jgi:hypothetical protein
MRASLTDRIAALEARLAAAEVARASWAAESCARSNN